MIENGGSNSHRKRYLMFLHRFCLMLIIEYCFDACRLFCENNSLLLFNKSRKNKACLTI